MLAIVIDVVLVALLVLAVVGGAARGLIASLGALIGLVAGGIAAWWLMPVVGPLVPSPEWRGTVVLATGAALLVVGTAVGSAIGAAVRRRTDRLHLKPLDRILGAALSLVLTALSISLVAQSVAVAGIPTVSAAVASSRVLGTIESITPTPVTAAIAQVRQAVLTDGLPRLGQLIELGPAPETAPPVDLQDPALDAAAQSVARVSGAAPSCGQNLTGSGFVVAPDRVVTNAHVVAGVDDPVVELPGRAAADGKVVYFDPVDDLAVIAVDVHGAPPLALSDVLSRGAAAVFDGYPYGGPFTSREAVVRSVGVAQVPDIYDSGTAPREIYALQATVEPGNSGGPLLTAAGEVAGVVFARADDGSQVGYAMTVNELQPVAAQAAGLASPVATGACAR
ncbi:MarP family serine protease [Microbacterium sp. SORGH_AS_0888]|uniref:MarP family serine protease n=1 Tax=Microbacterium sp. SORGH_AS_0888 TaxID=3041791 RepID=UPI00277F5DC4|nr:MarP family serine protease [Microbacterium sp. SORGH_AS_0888]MDQ1128162.1 S1-C subfamily serine protease [Microbacterium sp. SORGH_AS_0888]